jgi:hypothetical protein
LAQVLNDAQSSVKTELTNVKKERTEQRKERTRHHNELQDLVINGMTTPDVTRRIAELNELLASDDQRLTQLDTKIGELECQTITKEQAKAVFNDFDGKAGTVSVTFRPTSIHSLISRKLEEAA